MKKNASINRVMFFNMLGPMLLNGLAFFTMPIFTRLLGTEQYGIYVTYASYLSIFSVIIGFQSAGAIAPASVRYSGKERESCFSSIMTAAIFSAVLIGGICLSFLPTFASLIGLEKHLAVVLILHATCQFVVYFTTAKASYEKNSHINFLISVSVSMAGIVLSLIFIYLLPQSFSRSESYIYGHAIPYIVCGPFLAAYHLLKGKVFFRSEYWKFALQLCLPLIFHQLSNTLLHQCDKIMLDKITTKSFVGIYGFAVSFANIMNIIWSALNTTFVPFYHDDIRDKNPEKLYKKTRNYLFVFTILTLGFIYAQPEVVKIFAQKDYYESINIIPLLTVGLYFVFLYSFPVNFEFYYRKTKIIAIGTCFAAIANILFNASFINLWGMVGAAAATLLSYLLLWIFHLLLANFVIKESYHFKYRDFYYHLIIVVVGTALFYIVKDLPSIRWIICAGLGAALLYRIKKQKSVF